MAHVKDLMLIIEGTRQWNIVNRGTKTKYLGEHQTLSDWEKGGSKGGIHSRIREPGYLRDQSNETRVTP